MNISVESTRRPPATTSPSARAPPATMDAKLAVLAALALLSKPQAAWPAPPTRVPATVVVPAGTFVLGHSAPLPINLTNNILQRVWGDADEWPKTPVNITRPFHAAVTEVTNAQFEAFDPSHSRYRGLYPGLGLGDDEAVLFVTWAEAAGYARWLANRTGTPFRLPTEGEWEWMCRAGTLSAFSTGDSIPAAQQKNQQHTTKPPADVNLTVAMCEFTSNRKLACNCWRNLTGCLRLQSHPTPSASMTASATLRNGFQIGMARTQEARLCSKIPLGQQTELSR